MIKEDYIKLLDVIFNEKFENNNYSKKWKNFDDVSSEIENFDLEDFIDNCSNYFESNRGIDRNISGAIKIINDFPIFTTTGIHDYFYIKEQQIKNVLYENGRLSNENTSEIFNRLNFSAVKQIINNCIDKKIIECNGRIYENNKIMFDKIIQVRDTNIVCNNYICNNGTMNNVSQTVNYNDDQLYTLINSKIDLLRNELGKEHNEKIEELINAINNKNRKSVLTTLSELATIGSAIANGIMTMIS